MEIINTSLEGFTLKRAERSDMKELYKFICDFAEFENLSDSVKANPEILEQSIFEEKVVKCVMPQFEGKSIGYCLYFNNFSSFEGRKGLYLEDIYIAPDYRSRGYGKKIFEFLAHEAIETGCTRFDWVCLDWNKPALNFYKSIGARVMEGWLIMRLEAQELKFLAKDL